MKLVLNKATLTSSQRKLLEACGPDAQSHPLVIDDDNRLRFQENAAVAWLKRNGKLDLGALYNGLDMDMKNHRLGLREFYRMMGYSVASYLEMFGDQIRLEERHK